MSEAALVALIFALCPGVKPEQRIACHEAYVNCAVTEAGILTRAQFETKCMAETKFVFKLKK